MEAYLDNAATTRCYEEVRDIVAKTMTEDYGNPSSMHRKGVEAENYMKESARTIAKLLKVQEKEIYFTSGGTESNNWALVGCAMANRRRGKHLITTAFEHAAVSAPMAFLEEQGFEVTRLLPDGSGQIDPEELRAAVRQDTILVSVMYVNNEIGAAAPVGRLGAIIKEQNPETYFHVDAIQAFGKYRILPKKEQIDLMSVSGHKIHGPKGVGFLYAGERVKLHPLILGGGQQNGMRSGTDNVPGAAGLGKAAEMIYGRLQENTERMRAAKLRLANGLSALPEVRINGPAPDEGAPHILNVSFLGVRSEVLLHALEEYGIYVSAGSACSTHRRAGSSTLAAIGLSAAEQESAVRFSFCGSTTEEEIDYTLEKLCSVVPMLRRFQRK